MSGSEQKSASGEGQAALERFLGTVPLLNSFREGVNSALYMPIPNTWFVATSDVIGSTEAIANGQYKMVNMVGAGVIAAAMNALGTREFPFVFSGDGATFVVPPQFEQETRHALAAMRRWTTDETDLRLRAAMVPVERIRGSGVDVRLARFAPNENVSYAMFAGGGLAWAESEMKAGRFEVPRASEGVRPDLEGLSCRWSPAESVRGDIVSLIVTPQPETSPGAFQKLEGELLDAIRTAEHNDGHPLTPENTHFSLGSAGQKLELLTSKKSRRSLMQRVGLWLFTLFGWTLFRFNIKSGDFDPVRYRVDLRANSDFRKFDDGLKLTIDCTPETVERLEALLEDALEAGTADYGLHCQKRALMTCIVPSITTRDHVHFVDGADGGYARAAEKMKLRKREREGQSAAPAGVDRRQYRD